MLQSVFHADPTRDRSAGLTPRLRAALIASAVLHVAVILMLVFGLPNVTPEEPPPPDTAVAMVFQGPPQPSNKAPTPAKTAAPSKEAAPPAQPVTEPPKQQPIEAPPPPPPPPPPPQAQQAPTPPVPTPPVPTPPAPTPPIPPPPVPPPPAEPTPTPTAVIPPPPAPPPPTAQTTQTAKAEQPPLPLPPPVAPPPPSPPSTTSQPNPTKNAAADSKAIDNTLEKLRQQVAMNQPPHARPNPQSGGAGGGNPSASDTASLTAEQRGAIGDHVRECWTKDAGALDIERMQVMLTVVTDASGVAREAKVVGGDVGRMSDPRFRAFAERAIRAIMDPRCANLPLPRADLGRNNTLTFRFSP